MHQMCMNRGEVKERFLRLADGGAQDFYSPHGTVTRHEQISVTSAQVGHCRKRKIEYMMKTDKYFPIH